MECLRSAYDGNIITVDDIPWRRGKIRSLGAQHTHTHIGDARATEMKRSGMQNFGQLAKERAEQAFLLIDDTPALRPLHAAESPDAELSETFPTGL